MGDWMDITMYNWMKDCMDGLLGVWIYGSLDIYMDHCMGGG